MVVLASSCGACAIVLVWGISPLLTGLPVLARARAGGCGLRRSIRRDDTCRVRRGKLRVQHIIVRVRGNEHVIPGGLLRSNRRRRRAFLVRIRPKVSAQARVLLFEC